MANRGQRKWKWKKKKEKEKETHRWDFGYNWFVELASVSSRRSHL